MMIPVDQRPDTITAEYFQEATGREPKDDDLERCNCSSAGALRHSMCGWNWDKNLPCFEVGPEIHKSGRTNPPIRYSKNNRE